MKLLLDEWLTRYPQRDLAGHDVYTVDEAGFKGLKNGVLLARAADDGFDVLVTADQNVGHQQNVRAHGIAVLVLAARRNSYDALRPLLPQALEALKHIKPGDVVIVRAS